MRARQCSGFSLLRFQSRPRKQNCSEGLVSGSLLGNVPPPQLPLCEYDNGRNTFFADPENEVLTPGIVPAPRCVFLQITTPSSTLRDWRIQDAPSLVKHGNNLKVAAMLRDGFPHPYTPADARQFIQMATGETPDLFLAIDVGGEAVGGIGIHVLNDVKHRSAEIGYWLSEPLWGRGIVTDAVCAIVPVAFGRYDINRLQAGIFSSNPASMRVLTKCGFVCEAVHKDAIFKNGVFIDEILYVRFR